MDLKINETHMEDHTTVHVDNYQRKIELIEAHLKEAKSRKTLHYSLYSKYKKWNTFIDMFINLLNAASVSSLVLNFAPKDEIITILSLSFTSVSAFISATKTSFDVSAKYHSHQTSFLQYVDLYRDVSARLQRNGLSSKDLDILLSEINSRLGLIEDNSLPLSVKQLVSDF